MQISWVNDIVSIIGNFFMSLPEVVQILIVATIAMALIAAEASSNAKRRAAEEEERRQRLKNRKAANKKGDE